MNTKLKIEFCLAIAALTFPSLAGARDEASYPSEKLASLIIEKLDVTSLPVAYRPKKQKGKKTFAEYGYTVQKLEEKQALLEMDGGTHELSISILRQSNSGIYACFAQQNQDGTAPSVRSVIFLKGKPSKALLKGRESWRGFKSCPVVGGSDGGSAVAGGD